MWVKEFLYIKQKLRYKQNMFVYNDAQLIIVNLAFPISQKVKHQKLTEK